LLVTASVVGTFLHIAYQKNAYTETKAALNADILGFMDVYNFSGSINAVRSAVDQRLKSREISSFYLLLDKNAERITGNLLVMPAIFDSRDGDFVIYEIPYGEPVGNAPKEHDPIHPYYDVMIKTTTFDDGTTLLIGRDIDTFETSRQATLWLAWIAAGLACIMALIGFLMGSLILRHVRLIHTTANTVIETGNLSARIPVEKTTGDFRGLADTLNGMLARIEDLVTGSRQVSDNIAHDLRTPLTRLKHHIEAFKKGEDEVNIDDIAAETDRIITTFNALLRIANIEHGKRSAGFEALNLQTLLTDLHEYYVLLAQEKGITLEIDIPLALPEIMGDKDLLFQAFSNMMENAMKYTPEGGNIAIRAETNDEHISVTINDAGPGIADKNKPKVFRRFYRTEDSRHTPGNGLGLSLVKAVIDLHKADISLSDNTPSGLCVTVIFHH
jgi:signal transduction histidine kinase